MILHRQLPGSTGRGQAASVGTVPSLLAARARSDPDQVALTVDGVGDLTFAAWLQRSHALAGRLTNRVDPRLTMATGFACLIGAQFMMSGFDIVMDRGPIVIDRKLKDVPPIGVVTGSLIVATILYAPFVPLLWPTHTTSVALASVAGLGVVCTAAAFMKTSGKTSSQSAKTPKTPNAPRRRAAYMAHISAPYSPRQEAG